jgi:hypothetical protein
MRVFSLFDRFGSFGQGLSDGTYLNIHAPLSARHFFTSFLLGSLFKALKTRSKRLLGATTATKAPPAGGFE